MESMRRFTGTNPIRGAIIDYVLPKKTSRVALKIVDVSGRTVAELKPGTDAGLHRIVWNLQTINFPRPKDVSEAELQANPIAQALFGSNIGMGTYRVVFTTDGLEQSAPLVVESDPNAPRPVEGASDEVEEERALRRLERRSRLSDDR